jgi:hypothetical protein
MITADEFALIRASLGEVAEDDIAWAHGCCPPKDEEAFAREAIFVICNSGMKNTIARKIFERCMAALCEGTPVRDVFGHAGKAAAIEHIWRHQGTLFIDYVMADDKLANLAALPWIGEITKFHLAKNFGADVAKPDVHLQRLADREGCTAQELCERLAKETGLRVAAIDTVLWRACANGILDSRTGAIRI